MSKNKLDITSLLAEFSNSPSKKNKTVSTLRRLSFNAENKEEIGAKGGIAFLLDSLDDSRANVRIMAAEALNNLAGTDKNQQRIAELSGVIRLAPLLCDKNRTARERGLDTFISLSRCKVSRSQMFLTTGVLSSLKEILSLGNANEKKRSALIISKLASGDENRQALGKLDFVSPLVDCLKSRDVSLRVNASQALDALLTESKLNQLQFAQVDGIAIVMPLLLDNQECLQAIKLLMHLPLAGGGYKQEMIKAGAIKRLKRLLRHASGDLQRVAISLLENLQKPDLGNEVEEWELVESKHSKTNDESLQTVESKDPASCLEINPDSKVGVVASLKTVTHRDRDKSKAESLVEQLSLSSLPSPTHVIKKDNLTYDTLNCLGSGGFGDVYLGKWRGNQVAVKVLKDQNLMGEKLAEFKAEGALMINLHHPNIVRAYGMCLDPSHYALVMQHYSQGSLYSMLKSEGVPAWPRQKDISLGISRGLEYLHDHDVLHRDLKSPNILMEGERPVIADFGLSKIKTATKMIKSKEGGIGSIPWMAPEMIEDDSEYDSSCDIYGLAMIFYEMLSGKVPWCGMNVMAIIFKVVNKKERPPMPSEVPVSEPYESYKELMGRCWAQRSEDRPKLKEVIASLEAM